MLTMLPTFLAALASFVLLVAPYPLRQAEPDTLPPAGSESPLHADIPILSILQVAPSSTSPPLLPIRISAALSAGLPSVTCLSGCSANPMSSPVTLASLSTSPSPAATTPSTTTDETAAPTATTAATVPTSDPTVWAMPTSMKDLSSFNITDFADGSSNVRIVAAVPSSASVRYPSSSSMSTPPSTLTSIHVSNTTEEISNAAPSGCASAPTSPQQNSSTMLQVYYPEGSSDPANEPLGGADFYASPISVLNATSVTLRYSVFFPLDFDFVKGGKLPGLYGGHEKCSGGAVADDCFSTRLMWRDGGMGELYLYAPRAMQSTSLCTTPPLSICNSTDGMSIGRGSFNFTKGEWTNVQQTVMLNTPGIADGNFVLLVNGVIALNSSAVYYRNAPSTTPISAGDSDQQDQDQDSADNSLLGGFAGGLLDNLTASILLVVDSQQDTEPQTTLDPRDASLQLDHTQALGASLPDTNPHGRSETNSPTGFLGLFFSTFFGGEGADWAATADTQTWFKDFAIIINE